jgi:hypothetical protein
MNTLLRHLLPLLPLLAALPASAPAQQSKTTDVLVMLTVKPEIQREKVTAILPEEVRETVQLYLDGKIRQWFSRSDGKGVIFILSSHDVSEARAVMESLPLAKANLVNLDYTPMAPLAPLGVLIGPPAGKP